MKTEYTYSIVEFKAEGIATELINAYIALTEGFRPHDSGFVDRAIDHIRLAIGTLVLDQIETEARND